MITKFMRANWKNPFENVGKFALLAPVLLACAGCVSKATAQAEIRAAYLAGQRDALRQAAASPASKETSITVFGPVKNPVIPWVKGLTLSQAIVTAGYLEASDPKVIRVKRLGQAIQFDVQRLLAGEDFHLEPGDAVEIE